jgi:hypothetical protein
MVVGFIAQVLCAAPDSTEELARMRREVTALKAEVEALKQKRQAVRDETNRFEAVDKRFDDRAFAAEMKILELGKKALELKEDQIEEANRIVAQLCLESAYMAHTTVKETVQKRDEDSKYFHLFLKGDSELFDLVYKYSKDGELVSTQVKSLPKDWHLVLSPRALFVVTKENSVFRFSLSDPFESEALNLSRIERDLLKPTSK